MGKDKTGDGETQTEATASGEFEELRALDGRYRPIDSFEEWATLTINDDIWNRQVSFLDKQRNSLRQDDLDSAINVATRAAAVDTGAIEGLYETDRGLTTTIAFQEPEWETAMRSRQERLPDFFKAHLAAFDLASEVAARKKPVTEAWIRELHEVLTGPQAEYDVLTPKGWVKAPLPKGQYKDQPNHVNQKDGTKHIYAPVSSVSSEMHRLVEDTKTEAFGTAHPVLQAAYVHYALVAIHPFADGNGRVARSLASIYLRRGASIPLLIWSDQRTEYFDALEAGDSQNRKRFVEFIFDRSIDALTFVANRLGPSPEDELAKLGELYLAYGGLTFAELNAKAGEIRAQAISTIRALIGEWSLPKDVTVEASTGGGDVPMKDPGYGHPVGGPSLGHIQITSRAPASAAERVSFHVVVAQEEKARYAFRLETEDEEAASIELRLSDVHPDIAESVITQFRELGRRIIGNALVRVNEQATIARKESGFL